MHKFPLTVYYADTDAGGVVYHARYLEFFERARFDWLESISPGSAIPDLKTGGYVVVEASIKYKRPAKLGDRLTVETSIEELQRASIVLHQSAVDGSGTLLCEGLI